MMSTTGRIPVIAAPRAMPVMPASEIGESTIRSVPASATSSPIRNTVGSRRSSSASASRTACAIVSSRVAATEVAAGLGEDMLGDLSRVGVRSAERVLDRLGDLRLDQAAELRHGGLVADATREEVDRVALCRPALLLLLRPVVGAVDVPDVVAVVAVGLGEEEGGPPAGATPLDGPPGGLPDREHVLPVDLLARDPERLGAGGDRPGRHLGEGRVLVVEVVLADVDDRQAPERRHVHHLVQEPLAERALAEEAHGDPVAA